MPAFDSACRAIGRKKLPCYARFTDSSDLCDQQHNCQAGGEARCSRTYDSA
jgi:hypothetical protein